MTASAVPTLMRALRDGFRGLLDDDVTVTLGVHLDQTPGVRVWVGYDDPQGQSSRGATEAQSEGTMGTRNRDVVGEIPCAILVQQFDFATDEALATAEGIVDAIGAWLADPAGLQLPQFRRVMFGSSTQWDYVLDEDEEGRVAAVALLVTFSVAFTARTNPAA